MNANRFRWVFSRRLGMRVPAPETARGQGKGEGGGLAMPSCALAFGLLWVGTAQAQMPVPCAGGACGSAIPGFVTHGAAGFSASGNQGFVTQSTPKAIVNWASYNLGAGNTLTYRFQDAAGNLPAGASFSTLNRIWQGSPSEIAGRIQVQAGQNGQITLINQNGILFRDGAQISVGSLTASTLDIADRLFIDGIYTNLTPDSVAAFTAAGGGGVVKLESGATLRTERGGQVLLLAQDVENHGVIETPEGQTLLAAGNKVYLAVSNDPGLRGFLVEVDGGGTASNTGRILAERGNVSITGLTVNQLGRVNATTSVSLNGSIRLMARDTVASYQPTPKPGEEQVTIPQGTRTGSLVFGAGSVTAVTPETASADTLLDEQSFNPSRIEAVGRTVHVQAGAELRATAGDIDLSAQAGQLFQTAGEGPVSGVRLQVEPGAVLDTAGLRDVAIPVERNYIQVEVRGSQLQDAPLQRDSFLYKSTVWIDIEQGTPLLNVAGDIVKVGRTVAEKSTRGGNIVLRSENELVLNDGARLDVSGGSIAYQAGWGRTTQLIQNGRVVDIGVAQPDQVYEGFADQYTATDAKWGVTRTWDQGRKFYVPAHVAGRDAGGISLTAHRLMLDAVLRGERVVGERQRTAPPSAGSLKIAALAASEAAPATLQDFRFVSTALQRRLDFGQTLPADIAGELLLSAERLRESGIGRLDIASQGRLTLPADVTLSLPAQGRASLTARSMRFEGEIIAPAGGISLTTRRGQAELGQSAGDYALEVDGRARLDVAGQWVNDLPGIGSGVPSATALVQGGSLSLQAYSDLILGPDVVLDASGGAWVQADGKLKAGKAGGITLASGDFLLPNRFDPESRIQLGGELRAYSLAEGGRLNLSTSSLWLGGSGSGRAGELLLGEDFFRQGGFRDYALTGSEAVTVAAGFSLRPDPVTWLLPGDHRLRETGQRLADFARVTRLLSGQRPGTSVALTATRALMGDVTVGEGARIEVDPRGSILLSAADQLSVLGTLAAPAGRISLIQTALQDAEKEVANFEAGRSVFLGRDSRLLAAGLYLPKPNLQGLRLGEVLDGGEVSLQAGKGYVVMQPGARIDVSGAAATLDLAGARGLTATPVASHGGSIVLSAREGLVLEGEFLAHGGGGAARGGSLSVELFRTAPDWTIPAGHALESLLNRQRILSLTASPGALSAAWQPGATLDSAQFNGRGSLSVDQVAAGGFADLRLSAQHRVRFEGQVDLSLAGNLLLQAPNFEASGDARVGLDAAAVQLGNLHAQTQGETLRSDATGGDGHLTVNADLLELVGHASWQGFGAIHLVSRGDLRLRGVVFDDPVTLATDYRYDGSLATGAGLLELKARQVYPVSLADFSIEIHNNAAGRIRVSANGEPTPVLSGGGRLHLAAPGVEQGGVLKAPLGEIRLTAATVTRSTNVFGLDGLPTGANAVTLSRVETPGGQVTLGAGSVTSVSVDGQVIPLGATELAGKDWLYDFGPYKRLLDAPPQRRVVLAGDKVDVAQGAKVDLSGGGDLLAREFLPGPGGSRDYLAAGNTPGLYAILPGLNPDYAPYDQQMRTGLDDAGYLGASVRLLEGLPGLAAGTYTLLPAAYALLPGAWLVQVAKPDSDLVPGRGGLLPTGHYLAAGQVGQRRNGGDLATSGRNASLHLAPGNLARSYSEYLETRSSRFHAHAAATLADAGQLSIAVGSRLDLAGQIVADAVAGGRGPELDIAADRLAVTAGGASYGDGHVTLGAERLAGFGAASLLLGGTRSQDGGHTRLTQRATEVVVAGGAELVAPELILAATDTVRVEAGAVVVGSGSYTGTAQSLNVGDASGEGDGALLRVSSGGQIDLVRAPASLNRGLLDIAAGATVQAGHSALLDATLDNRNAGDLVLPVSGGALNLGAKRISLVGDGSVVGEGLVFDQAALAALGQPASLRLASYTTLDVYGDVTLGDAGLERLAIEAAGIHQHAGGGLGLTAGEVGFANPNGLAADAAFAGATGAGTLTVDADRIRLGRGDFLLRGYTRAQLLARGEVMGQGGRYSVEGDLDLAAGRLTALAGVRQGILADGALKTELPDHPPVDLPAAALGGALDLTAATLTHLGSIELPAGQVSLTATLGDLRLNETGPDGSLRGGRILAGGRTLEFADTQAHAGGGSVRLTAQAGDVVVEGPARIDVAADPAGGNAGALGIWAAGDAWLTGRLDGDAASGHASGRFELVAGRINPDAGGGNDFNGLNAVLEGGGFHDRRHIRVRQGSLTLDTRVRAADILISTDTGDLTVKGATYADGRQRIDLDADGAQGGRIELYAGGNLDLQDATLSARATQPVSAPWGTRGEGGLVVLGSGEAGELRMSDARIDVSAAPDSAARGGRVVLRAARTGIAAGTPGGTGVALDTLTGSIGGARRVEVEGYKVYGAISTLTSGASVGSTLGLGTVDGENAAFVGAATLDARIAGLNLGDAALALLPGVEVRGGGNLTLSQDWDLNPLRYGGQGGVLTLRAAGDLLLQKNLSDGFSAANASGLLQTGQTGWSYRLAAGADTDAAAPLATRRDPAGQISLAANVLVRTGVGDLDAAAAGDILLATGAAVYTAGREAGLVADFANAPASQGYAFPADGGDLRLRAGGSVVSVAGPAGLVTDWLQRRYNPTNNATQFRAPGWWPRFSAFKDGVAALGGGDVVVEAGARVANLLAATATNAQQPALRGETVHDAARQVIRGGGDLQVRAAGDIQGGLFHADRGVASIEAGGAVLPGVVRGSREAATVLALGDARVGLAARLGITLGTVVNPGLVEQPVKPAGEVYFVTYGRDSGARLMSLAGDIDLTNDQAGLAQAYGVSGSAGSGALLFYPGGLEAVAAQGNLNVHQGFTLAPTALGSLRLLAGESVTLLDKNPIVMSDASPDAQPRLQRPVRDAASVRALTTLPALERDRYSPVFDEKGEILRDRQPVYVVAGRGDIVGQAGSYVFAHLPKAAVLAAGRDIQDVTLVGQNLAPDDVTRILAGRDIRYRIERDPVSQFISSINEARVTLGGPGRLDLIAGRHLDLGAATGVLTRGNLANPYLPEGGAHIEAMAGVVAVDNQGQSRPISAALLDPVSLQAFFAELQASALESSASGDYTRGEAAIAALFPSADSSGPLSHEGDLSLFFSQIKTEQGGDILLLAPGGLVNAGLASATGFDRRPADLGIMTVRGGRVLAYTRGDFQVNSNRVFTIGDGDILLWSAEGNIDAGKGAKTASATPPPRLRIDAKGNFVLDVSQSIAGSGIGALKAGSNVYLVAPKGEINAGDAGIRAGGNLTIAAERVVGADNIQVGGVSAGVPAADTASLGASIGGLNNLGDAGKATQEATQSVASTAKKDEQTAEQTRQALAGFRPSFISVEVLGFGESGSIQDEAERRRRQEEERLRVGGA